MIGRILKSVKYTDSSHGVGIYKSIKRFQQVNDFPGNYFFSRNMLKLFLCSNKTLAKSVIFSADYDDALNYACNNCKHKPRTFSTKTDADVQGRSTLLASGIKFTNPSKRMMSKNCSNKEKKEKDNLTAVLYGIEDLRLEQRPIPKIGDNDVLLEMDCVGICGSDVHYLVNGRIGHFIVTKPMIIGHEASGIVVKLGKNVKTLCEGDRCAIEPGEPCRFCTFCKEGKYNLCPDMIFCATPPYDGNLTRFYKHPADFCFKLPDHVSMEEGALLEPLSVGVHACRRAGVGLGSKVLIMGAGPIGLATLLTAQSMGASEILVTDLVQQRLDVAKEMGATYTLCLEPEAKAKDIAKQIQECMNEQPDVSIDCCGAESTTQLGIFATRSGGCCVIVGMGAPEPKLPLMNALSREVDVRGVFRYCNDYSAALALVASGKVNAKRMITHHFDMKETSKAFDTARHGTGGAIKVIIHAQARNKNNKEKV